VFGLALALSLLALLVLLPLMTSMRLLRLSRELEAFRDRLDALEAELLRKSPRAADAGAETWPSGSHGAAREAAAGAPDAPVALGAPEYSGASAAAGEPRATIAPEYAPAADDDLEGRIGGRWLLYTGVLVLLLGVSFFLKYAFDNAWINETGRVVAGILAGIALVGGGWRLATHGLAIFGQALIGTGLAILYLSIYAALAFYFLIATTTAFLLMVVVTLTAALLADRQRSQTLAFIAVGGGFLTPFLVGGSEDAQLTLFAYDALLVAGTLVLAQRHDWVALNALSYVFTVATVVGWAGSHYRDSLWLRTLLFLTLFCVMFLQILRDTRRSPAPAARTVVLLLSSAPVLYHIAAVVLTAQHPPAIHIYMITFTAVGLWLTAEPHRPGTRLVVLAASYVPLFGNLTLPDGLSWTAANTVTTVAVAALHLLALLDRVIRQERRLDRAELVALHVVAIGLYGLLHATLSSAYPELRGGLAAILALGALVLWQTLQHREPVAALNACAIAFTLTAIAIAVQFDGPAVVVGWAAEGAAAAWIGLRLANAWVQVGGLALWTLAIIRLMDGYFDTPAAFTAVFNQRALTTAFVVAIGYVLGWFYAKHRDTARDAGRVRAALHVAASVVTMIWITAEVESYWEVRYDTPQADLYEQLILSLAWGAYGALLIVAGLWRSYAPDRYLGITVLGVTILKVFFSDLWQLGGIYRVVAFISFGVLLVGVSYLYQKRRAGAPSDAERPAPPLQVPPEAR
jgi:uncharacterized membrane protein